MAMHELLVNIATWAHYIYSPAAIKAALMDSRGQIIILACSFSFPRDDADEETEG